MAIGKIPMTPANHCLKCQEFDEKTKDLLAQILGPDEISHITMLLSASIKIAHITLKANENNVPMRVKCKRDMDFSAAIAGKLLIGIEPEPRQALIQAIIKHHGIALRVNHEQCPHQEKKKLEAVP